MQWRKSKPGRRRAIKKFRKAARNQKVFDEGWMAWGEGVESYENPYPISSEDYGSWLAGWRVAEEDYEEQRRG
jgi:hypothetical protein